MLTIEEGLLISQTWCISQGVVNVKDSLPNREFSGWSPSPPLNLQYSNGPLLSCLSTKTYSHAREEYRSISRGLRSNKDLHQTTVWEGLRRTIYILFIYIWWVSVYLSCVTNSYKVNVKISLSFVFKILKIP